MNEERKGQIALKVLKSLMRKRGILLLQKDMSEDVAREIGVPIEELMRFAQLIVRELAEQTFPASFMIYEETFLSR